MSHPAFRLQTSRWFVLAAALAATSLAPAAADEDANFFTQQVQPLLEAHCYGCHSHATGDMEGGLTLDSRSGWAEGGDRGPAVVPGDPEQSLLITAIRHQDADLQMPPDEPLSPASVDVLIEWVRRGAPDPRIAKPEPTGDARADAEDPLDWWSLRPLQRPSVPQLPVPQLPAGGFPSHSPPVNAIDAFVQKRLHDEGLAPAPPADRRTLIRRLMMDLHGLPPTPEQVAAFVADPDVDAYQHLVDRLLDSPRYGERWSRHWLDTVHFADSHGCEHDVFRPDAWRYRDYVIDSFNQDTPWSRFIREQLAADRFFPDQPQLTPALGFIAAGPLELSRAGTAPVTFDYLDRDDMVTQTMAAFASSTANCARCHDHKFDPIRQEDYYALQAVFAGAGKGSVQYDEDSAVAQQRRRWEGLLKAASAGDATVLLAAEYADVVRRWEDALGDEKVVWLPLPPTEFQSSGGAALERLEDDSLRATGTRPEKDTYTIKASTSLTTLTALRVDVLSDDSLPMKGPGRADNGNLHLSEFEAFVVSSGASEAQRIPIAQATADWDQEGWTIAHALDGNEATAWGIYPKVGLSHRAVFQLQQPQQLEPGSQIQIVLKQLHGGQHLIGRVKLYATAVAGASLDVLPDAVQAAIQVPRDQRSESQHAAIAAFVLREHAQQQLAALPPQSSVYAVSPQYSHAVKQPAPLPPKVVHVLRRGDIDNPGEVARSGALSAITALPGRFELSNPDDEASRRAALADWLAAPENPLTWRSIVNRVWHYHFGRGICDTPNDFGRMGGTPSHGELLDWLAVWFRDDAQGSLKQLHRLIVLSATYQQTSRASDLPAISADAHDPQAVDAQNRLLWRMNRRPLDAESFRDAVMQISGRLDLTMGGPGIQQFTQSKGQQSTPKLDYDAFDWDHPDAGRRSIYRVVWRGIADPFMEAMDFPDLGILAPTRGMSVSSLQALAVFNNDFVLHHSRVLAERLESQYASVDEQVAEACRLVFLRDPSDNEQSQLTAYARQHGLAATCRILLNSNAFLFVD